MLCRHVILCLLHRITETIQVPVSRDLTVTEFSFVLTEEEYIKRNV
jgi:hypothetical protein